MKLNTALATAAVATIGLLGVTTGYAKPANAATVTYQQRRVCHEVPAQPARYAGYTQVGNQVKELWVPAKAATTKCMWINDGNRRAVTHGVNTIY